VLPTETVAVDGNVAKSKPVDPQLRMTPAKPVSWLMLAALSPFPLAAVSCWM
jgi:hypothetical protein